MEGGSTSAVFSVVGRGASSPLMHHNHHVYQSWKQILFVEQLDTLQVCVPYSRLPTGIPIQAVFQNLSISCNSNKTSLCLQSKTYERVTHLI